MWKSLYISHTCTHTMSWRHWDNWDTETRACQTEPVHICSSISSRWCVKQTSVNKAPTLREPSISQPQPTSLFSVSHRTTQLHHDSLASISPVGLRADRRKYSLFRYDGSNWIKYSKWCVGRLAKRNIMSKLALYLSIEDKWTRICLLFSYFKISGH